MAKKTKISGKVPKKIPAKTTTNKKVIKELKTLLDNKKPEPAIKIIDKILKKKTKNPEIYHLKGLALALSQKYPEAETWIKKSIEMRGPHWLYMKNLALVNRHMGNLDDAVKNLTIALEQKKDDYEMYRFMSENQKYDKKPAYLDDIERFLKNDKLKKNDKAHLHFAAGKIYDDLKSYNKAFAHYKKGNDATGRTVDMNEVENTTRKMIYAYSKSYLERAQKSGVHDASPVFVVGMPRSGTSLMETIIASHPLGVGAGEMIDMNKIANTLDEQFSKHGGYPDALPRAKGDFREGYGRAYLNNVMVRTQIKDPNIRIVDKQPLNFLRLGLIAEMFPKAKIIHMRRDPRDTCLSCYFQHFVNMQHYTFNMVSLGRYYRIYERLMEHWQQVMPHGFITVDYENLVENFEAEARRVIAYLDLAWDDACLTPNKSKNLMQTASAWQVRQPVYKTSRQRWKNYEKHLTPLLKALYAGR